MRFKSLKFRSKLKKIMTLGCLFCSLCKLSQTYCTVECNLKDQFQTLKIGCSNGKFGSLFTHWVMLEDSVLCK